MEEMATAGLGFGSILLIVAVMAYYGVFGMVGKVAEKATVAIETGANMGLRELIKTENEQIARHDEWYAAQQLNKEEQAKADEARKQFSARRKLL